MRRIRSTLVIAAALVTLAVTVAAADPQPRRPPAAAELRADLHRLQVTGSVLYIGAHPDDDNTTLLAYLARGRLLRAAYLSLTRGDGGQNILGTEQGQALGVLRTQELLASRRVDGAEQFFTRAIDYGFSKSPDEALAIWGHDRILADMVWVIRRFRPDVIVSRFGTDGSGGHGHHTASAILAGEAFRLAGDATKFPEQLKYVAPWQAKRLVWNRFLFGAATQPPPPPGTVTLDAGGYDPALGLSYGEIGGRARSLNRSQGAGTRERRGSVMESFVPVAGDTARTDLMDGVVNDWSRVPASEAVAAALGAAERAFDPAKPWQALPDLARAHAALAKLPRDPLVVEKQRELEGVMRSCAGLWLEAIAPTPTVSPGDSLSLTITVFARCAVPLSLARIEAPFGARAFYAGPAAPASPGAPPAPPAPDLAAPASAPRPLPGNRSVTAVASLALPADLLDSQPYWLRERPLPGSFVVDDPRLIGDAENAPEVVARVTVDFAGEPVTFEVPVVYRWTDRVYGDRYRDLEIVPPVTCHVDEGVYLFAELPPARQRLPIQYEHDVRLAVQSTRAAVAGTAHLIAPAGWNVAPARAAVSLAPGAEQILRFQLTAPPRGRGVRDADTLRAEVEVNGRAYGSSIERVDYPHVPIQTMLPPCEANLVHTDLARRGEPIGYLMGSGDQVPDALREMGYRVALLDDDEVERGDLSRFSCIVAGVRAYNVRPRLRTLEPRLLDYVKAGGRLVIQYQTPEDALNDRLGPWPFTVSRDRVAVEQAEMRFLKPADPLLTVPNRITARDFDGWVQERGLYYASPFDPRYEAPLSANDPGEPPRDGGLISTRYGKGVFIYTGLAFFRQLPAGVPGAWRLFANLVSPTP